MARRSRRGFTLLELVVVIGIVSIMAGLAAYSASRSQDRVQIDRATSSLRSAIERARALARVAGPRLGTARINYGPDCPNPGGNFLWIDLDPGSGDVFIPSSIQYTGASDQLDVRCERWDYGGTRGAEDEASFVSPAGRVEFGFSANGRLVFAPGTTRQDLFVQLRHDPSNSVFPGFRVLPAGATCLSSQATPMPEPCDEDMN